MSRGSLRGEEGKSEDSRQRKPRCVCEGCHQVHRGTYTWTSCSQIPQLRAALGQNQGRCLCRRETHRGGVTLELCTLRLPGGLGLGELLLKLRQASAFVPQQPAQLLEGHLHVGQCLDVLIGLQTRARPGSGALRGAARGAWAGSTYPKLRLGPCRASGKPHPLSKTSHPGQFSPKISKLSHLNPGHLLGQHVSQPHISNNPAGTAVITLPTSNWALAALRP